MTKTKNAQENINEEGLASVESLKGKNTLGDSLTFAEVEKLKEFANQSEEQARLLDEATERYKRLQADFENFKRRTVKEKEDISNIVLERVVLSLLPVMDNFERALLSSNEDSVSLKAGLEMIFKQLNDVFAKLGVEPIAALNSQFDPNLHEAVMRDEASEAQDGTIVMELQKGYRLNSRTIRASMVKVAGQ